VAAPVLLVSNDPFLGASLEAVARGRVRVARIDASRRPAAWPAGPTATVVLDVTAGQRDALHAWVRRHHSGPLVVVLKPGERDPALPPDPTRVVMVRPFRVADLVAILEQPPPPLPAADAGPGARQLLQASATQRMRRLGSLSRAGPAAAPPAAVEGALPPGWPTAATRLEVPRRRPVRRGRAVAARVLVGLLVVAALAGAWLGLGLVETRQDLLVGAAGVRVELARAEAALERGRPAEAAAAVRAARRSLEVTAAVLDRREPRAAGRLPVLSGGIADSRRLLAAADGLVDAGDHAVAVAAYLRSGRGTVRDGAGRDDAAVQARRMLADLERARAELARVRGGPLAPGVGDARRWALERLEAAGERADVLVAALGRRQRALDLRG
jgi:hypothetical protein